MSKNTIFTSCLIAILFGIAIFYSVLDLFLFLYIIFCIILIFILFFQYYGHGIVIFFIIIGCLLGGSIAYFDYGIKSKNGDIVDRYMGLYIGQQGTVKKLYKRSDFYDEYALDIDHIGQESITDKLSMILRIPKNFELQPGQMISFYGKLYSIDDFNGFSYQKYMLSQNIYFTSSTNIFSTITYPNTKSIQYILYTQRQSLLQIIDKMYPREEAIFLGGILLGARENIPQDLKEDFNNSGLTHFIAVSGFNITLCIIFMTLIFGWLPMWGRVCMVSVSIIIFSFFVGLGAPVIRAAIMGILGYIFLESGNSMRNITLLTFTAVCMSLFSPMVLLYDVSFHLSFLAVIGIIYTQDFFKKIFFFVPEFFAIREAFILTLSALTFSLPIMMFQFGQVSLLAPFANIAVTWTIPLAMLVGLLSIIAESIFSFGGDIVGFFAFTLLSYDISVVRFFGNMEFALVRTDFGPYKNYLEAFYFIFLIYLVVLYHVKRKKQP